jgi:hypothetical protein
MIRFQLLLPLTVAAAAVMTAQTPRPAKAPAAASRDALPALTPWPAAAPEPAQDIKPSPAPAPAAPWPADRPEAFAALAGQFDRANAEWKASEEAMSRSLYQLDRAGLEHAAKAQAFALQDADFARRMAEENMLLAQKSAGWNLTGRSQNEDRLYESGQSALDGRRYEQALQDFNQVTARGGVRADAAWYWKAYTLNKLGRRDEAIAALAELRKSYSSSRWLDDAKALELEVKQQSGKPVSPEGESDEDLKLMALNGLMQSDPDRAVPLIENLLKGSQSPRLKQRALYVLAVSNTPRAQQVLEQVARGGANPDLQYKAVTYIASMRRKGTPGGAAAPTPAILNEVYGSSNDPRVKRAIIDAYRSNHDNARLIEIARGEKIAELRQEAFRALGNNAGQPELWSIYQSETSPDVKQQILNVMWNNGDAQKLAEAARTEKDPAVRMMALRVLASQKTGATSDNLVSLYNAEQDARNKRTIADTLFSQKNAKALVDIARAEKDPQMKLSLVNLLSRMKSKEASDYLTEILTK